MERMDGGAEAVDTEDVIVEKEEKERGIGTSHDPIILLHTINTIEDMERMDGGAEAVDTEDVTVEKEEKERGMIWRGCLRKRRQRKPKL
jgi:hypothetical protein